MHRIYVREAIEAGLADSDAGRVVEVSEVRRRFGLTPEQATGDDAWAELLRIGDELAAKKPLESETLTATLLKMRR